MPNTYEEQQKALRALVPKGTAGAAELESQGYTDVGIDTTQPSPETTEIKPSGDLTKVATEGIGPGGEPIYDVFAGQEHVQDPSDPRLKGVNIPNLPTGTAPSGFQSKFQKGFQDANAATGGNIPEGTSGAGLVNQYAPGKKNDLSSTFIQQDPYIAGLMTTLQQYMDPKNQRTSLADTYKTMLKDS